MSLSSYFFFIIAICAMAYNTVTDIQNAKIRNEVFLICLIIGLVGNIFFYGWNGFFIWLSGVGVMFVFIPLCYDKIPVIKGIKAIGMGDLKMFMSVGALLGMLDAIITICFSYVWAAIPIIILLICKKKPLNYINVFLLKDLHNNRKIKFAPYICLGTITYFILKILNVPIFV